MNESLLRKYIRNQIDDSTPHQLNELLATMFVAGATISWLSSDSQEDVADALDEVQDAVTDLQDAVEDMIDDIEHDLIAEVILEQGNQAVEMIKAGMEDARSAVQDAVASAIEGDEELMKEVPMGEAGKMANIAILAAIASVVASLTAPE